MRHDPSARRRNPWQGAAIAWLLATLALAACSDADLPAESGLRQAARASGRLVGAAVSARALVADPKYAEILAREFSLVTPENEMKWGPSEPEPGVWTLDDADLIVDFAEQNGMAVKGHALLWHMALPGWIDESVEPAVLRAAMESHIRGLVGRYRGRVLAWDVVNEAIGETGGMRDTILLRKLGPDYVADAFRIAHEADPDAILVYNDYLIIGDPGDKSGAIYELVRGLLAQGVPVHAVGLQTHLGYFYGLEPDLRATIARLASLGVEVNLSEVDVQTKSFGGDPATWPERQREVYEDVVGACVESPACPWVTFWGFTDRYSWIDSFFGADDPLLFDDDLQPKPAYFGVLDALRSAASG